MLLFTLTAPLLGLMSIGDPNSIIGFLLNLGDCVVVGIIMSLLGCKYAKVHNYSLSVLIFCPRHLRNRTNLSARLQK